MGCAKSQAVLAAEYRAVGRNRPSPPQFATSRHKPAHYPGPHLGNCIQRQQMQPAWTEAQGKEPEAVTRYVGKESLGDMRITRIDPIVTIGRGGPIAADAPCSECGAGPSWSGWRWNREMGFGCIRVMNCPEWECVGVLPARVGRLARSCAGDPGHNPGSDPQPVPRLAAQPGMRRTGPCPPRR